MLGVENRIQVSSILKLMLLLVLLFSNYPQTRIAYTEALSGVNLLTNYRNPFTVKLITCTPFSRPPRRKRDWVTDLHDVIWWALNSVAAWLINSVTIRSKRPFDHFAPWLWNKNFTRVVKHFRVVEDENFIPPNSTTSGLQIKHARTSGFKPTLWNSLRCKRHTICEKQ